MISVMIDGPHDDDDDDDDNDVDDDGDDDNDDEYLWVVASRQAALHQLTLS